MSALIARILDADEGIRPQVPETELVRSALLSDLLGCDVLLKTEHLLPTGSFKVRGSAYKIHRLGAAARLRGVVTASTGNHGLGVARAGAMANVPVTVYASSTTIASKLHATKLMGADVVVVDGGLLEAEKEAHRHSELLGKPYIAPYNDLDTVAGQGTIGLELMRQVSDIDAVFASVGGGGLIGGLGAAFKEHAPHTRVVGVWPEASRGILDWLLDGKHVETPQGDTLWAGTNGGVQPDSITFPICQRVIDQTVTVSEIEIARAMRHIAETEGWMIEGAAGVALAGLIKTADQYRDRKVAVVLCGRNIAVDRFMEAMQLAGSQGRRSPSPVRP
jgi:threonine dehydratase